MDNQSSSSTGELTWVGGDSSANTDHHRPPVNNRMGWTLAGLQRLLGMQLPTVGPLEYMAMRFGARRHRIINLSKYYREGTLREKVTGSYDWCPLQDQTEVYDWVARNGYSPKLDPVPGGGVPPRRE
jgi:hypothetical protein